MSELFRRLDEFIHSNHFFLPGEKLLVALSGGMDSMFLLSYLIERNYTVGVAHCNFGLRGEESEEDEKFVKSLCEEKNIPCNVEKFNTESYAHEHGISIQMAARDLRYLWFATLCETRGYQKILTAHHKTDHAETMLLNLVRGTGLKGLEGIAAVSGNIIRPLLCFTREEIEKEVVELKIIYREDSSNSSDKYYRNRIRHRVLPEFKNINPKFEDALQKNGQVISQANLFIQHYMESIRQEILTIQGKEVYLSISKLMKYPQPKFILYTILSDHGFNASHVEDIYKAIDSAPGKQFYSETHRLVTHNDRFILQPFAVIENLEFNVISETDTIETPLHRWQFAVREGHEISKDRMVAQLDLEKVSFPLLIRTWKQGDRIKPLGMQGHKKVSDIFIDNKLPITEKEKQWVLVSGNQVIWLAGFTVSEDFKTGDSTKKTLVISCSLKPESYTES